MNKTLFLVVAMLSCFALTLNAQDSKTPDKSPAKAAADAKTSDAKAAADTKTSNAKAAADAKTSDAKSAADAKTSDAKSAANAKATDAKSSANAKSTADAKSAQKAKGDKPQESPGWIILEEEWYFPLRFDSLATMNNARMLYRKHEEKAAASDLRRAVTWLKFAESHAEPITRSKLTTAASELTSLADDLDQGKLRDAASMEYSLARASAALAEWHYFKARESWGQSDEKYAAQYLQAAVAHLKHAAGSAHYQYGPDTVTVFDQVTRNDVTTSEAETFDHNVLGKRLDAIENAVKEMSDHLMKVAK